jgi:peptidoglycan/LPS O-acetylase OafA/YrhL
MVVEAAPAGLVEPVAAGLAGLRLRGRVFRRCGGHLPDRFVPPDGVVFCSGFWQFCFEQGGAGDGIQVRPLGFDAAEEGLDPGLIGGSPGRPWCWMVDGFFAISGFLITSSWLGNPRVRDYFVARGLRILPGFYICLVVIAVVVAPIGVAIQGGSAGKLLLSSAPIEYILKTVSGVVIHDKRFRLRTDLSYGVYIYACPIQQLLIIYGLGSMNPIALWVISAAASLPIAALSWTLVEKAALSLKSRIRRRSIPAGGRQPEQTVSN